MNFDKDKEKKLFSDVSSMALNKASNAQNNAIKRAMQQLPSKSDAEIEKMYRIRYNNPNWNDVFINALEREAMRRGIC